MLCIYMAKARRNKPTLKEKINLIDASHIYGQRQLDEIEHARPTVETAYKLRQTSMNDLFNVK